jgi:hypothetical protein
MKNLFILLVFFTAFTRADVLQFEGIVPPDVDKIAMSAEYHRIYRLVAPGKRPDASPLKIVFYSEKSGAALSGLLPEWGGGGTIGANLIVVPTTFKPFLDQSFSQITRHELVHAVLARSYPRVDIPRWFHEGVAMTLSGEISFEENVVVSKAIFAGSRMELSGVDSVNGFGRNRADLAYARSHLAVQFLIEQYGMETIAEILQAAQRTGSFWQGMRAVLSISPQEFDFLASKDMSSRYRFAFIFADYSALWVGIALLFLVATFAAIVRKRKKLDQMTAEEELEGNRPTESAFPVQKPSGPAGATILSFPKHKTSESNGSTTNEEEYFDDEQEEDEEDDYTLADGVELEDGEDDVNEDGKTDHKDKNDFDDQESKKPN